MKRGTIESPKLRLLTKRLNINMAQAIGTLEALWHFTARSAPEGDIGRHADEVIAEACFWDGDPQELINALVETHWVDRDDGHRLLIHDWPDHADDAIHKRLADHGRTFADGTRSRRDKSRQVLTHPDKSAVVSTPEPVPVPEPVPEPVLTQSEKSGKSYLSLSPRRGGGGGKGGNPPAPPAPDGAERESKADTAGKTSAGNGRHPQSVAYSPEFEAFWAEYPRATGKAKAWAAWQARAAPIPSIGDVLAAVARAKQSRQWRQDAGRFIPTAANWIHDRRWEDRPEGAEQAAEEATAERKRKHYWSHVTS